MESPSEVIVVYLGAGETSGYQPLGQQERLRAAFPRDFQTVRAALEKYLNFDHPISEWTSGDLGVEQHVFEQRLGHAFPELNERAINALACRWSFCWR